MDAHDAINRRRTIHTYTNEPVSEETIERALRAANQAPCHKKTFPWRFTLAGPMARAHVAELAVLVKGAARPLTAAEIEKTRTKVLAPSTLLVASQVRCPDPVRSREDYAACCCAIQNLMVAFAADGVGTKWSTGQLSRHPENYRIFGIDPGREEQIGFIWAGHGDTPQPIDRPPLEMVARRTP